MNKSNRNELTGAELCSQLKDLNSATLKGEELKQSISDRRVTQ